MKNLNISLPILIVLIAIAILFNSLYIINETKQVVITQFGKPIGVPVATAGIHIKVPFIQTLHFFDKRYLEWDGTPNQVPTKDKRFIWVDAYARWQIVDSLQFFKRLRDERGAQSRLSDILDGETRNAVADNNLVELVRTSNRTAEKSTEYYEEDEGLINIQIGRNEIQKQILTNANKRAKDLGIVIHDFRFKRISYVDEVKRKVYDRMTSERNRIAEKFRSEGQGEASKINGQREREQKRIESEAFRKAEEIKGKADAQAAKIYSDSYNRSKQSRDLYNFVKTMETFEKTFDEKTSVILSTNSDLYKYLIKLH